MSGFDELWQGIGLFVTAGGGVIVIAYGIFRKFGEKWLESKFEQSLTNYKHAQQKELERLRFSINSLLNRASKLADREFEALPRLWASLNDAFWQVAAFISPIQSYPDLERMTDTQLDEFLAKSPLEKWEKNELRASEKRNSYYMERIYWHKLGDATSLTKNFSILLAKDGIFLTQELHDGFSAIEKMLWDAITESKINREENIIPRESGAQNLFRATGESNLNKLKHLVHSRLWIANESSL